MRIITSCAIAASLLAGTALAETKTYDITGFTSVEASAGVDVEVTVGDAYSVTLETDDDIEMARVEKSGETLKLGREGRRGMSFNFGRGSDFRYTVTMPRIEGAGTSSGSEMTVSGIDAGALTLEASSGSELTASGTCSSLRASASSGSDIRAGDLSCAEVTARVSSGAEIETTATTSIDGRASSGGSIRVHGNPDRRDVRESSGGSISIKR